VIFYESHSKLIDHHSPQSAGISGKLLIFHTSLPISEALGKLKSREERKVLATEKEKVCLYLSLFSLAI
jgi:hypothetical protein